jgi:hypothetical protein
MALFSIEMDGIERVREQLRRNVDRKKNGFALGMKEAALLLQRESMKLVPVDTGNLRRTADTRNLPALPGEIVVVVVYSTRYAIYVHEMVELNHAPGKTAKFLERPARELRGRFLDIIKRRTLGIVV